MNDSESDIKNLEILSSLIQEVLKKKKIENKSALLVEMNSYFISFINSFYGTSINNTDLTPIATPVKLIAPTTVSTDSTNQISSTATPTTSTPVRGTRKKSRTTETEDQFNDNVGNDEEFIPPSKPVAITTVTTTTASKSSSDDNNKKEEETEQEEVNEKSKKPKNAYQLFYQEKKTEYLEKNLENLTGKQIQQQIQSIWKTLTPEEKDIYTKKVLK
eukprot:TRINITY_DN5257_c0_g3_i2.p1 TRINITY_DN5257_c0_g3~~TRINITY_DN5257_c0_g3_i2.p1  ORF type:complete len:217 (+),score=64.87 TRINITY_DN5257_c0_g3_i2:766-1416(+)